MAWSFLRKNHEEDHLPVRITVTILDGFALNVAWSLISEASVTTKRHQDTLANKEYYFEEVLEYKHDDGTRGWIIKVKKKDKKD